MVTEDVNKLQTTGKGTKKRSYTFYSPLIQTYLHKHFISIKKSKDISIWLVLAKVMSIFVETAIWSNFGRNSD